MIETPTIVTTKAAPAAVIRLTIPRAAIATEMGPAIGELLSTLATLGVAPVGPIYSHHLRLDPEIFDMEVGVPVSSTFTPEGRVLASEMPGVRAARTVLHGPYEELASAWGEFRKWIEAEGLKTASNFWEVYAKGPESGPDPAQWNTELYRALSE